MPDALEEVLSLVAEGRLTAAEAAPIVAALETARLTGSARPPDGPGDQSTAVAAGQAGRAVRLEVREGGRTVVNLRLPASLGESAMLRVPGIAGPQFDRIRAALASGLRGPVLEVGDDEEGVRIVID